MFIDTFEVRSKPLLKSITLLYSIMDHWRQHYKAYYEDNKEWLGAYRECQSCDKKYTRYNETSHLRSKYHQEAEKNLANQCKICKRKKREEHFMKVGEICNDCNDRHVRDWGVPYPIGK